MAWVSLKYRLRSAFSLSLMDQMSGFLVPPSELLPISVGGLPRNCSGGGNALFAKATGSANLSNSGCDSSRKSPGLDLRFKSKKAWGGGVAFFAGKKGRFVVSKHVSRGIHRADLLEGTSPPGE